jgi:hypothetical protein
VEKVAFQYRWQLLCVIVDGDFQLFHGDKGTKFYDKIQIYLELFVFFFIFAASNYKTLSQ